MKLMKLIKEIQNDYPFILWSLGFLISIPIVGIISLPFLIIDILRESILKIK
jgi:hypothetical protein